MKFLILTVVAVAIANVAAAGLLGGRKPALDHNAVKDAADKALHRMSSNTNGVMEMEVLSAEYQIIAGIKYYLDVEVTLDGVQKHRCSIQVTQRADRDNQWFVEVEDPNDSCYEWVNEADLPSVIQNRKRRSLLGGRERVDLTDEGIQEAANWAVDHINRRSNSMYRHALQKIADGSKQVVNGYKYRFLLYLVSTKCRNNEENSGKMLEECPTDDQPKHQQCDVSVLYSNKEYSMLDFKCKALKAEKVLGGDGHDYESHGKARSLLGGDDHDYIKHDNAKAMLGGDDHDYIKHDNAEVILGGDDHDYIKHTHDNAKALLGGDDHDYIKHDNAKAVLGGDDHDYIKHDNAKALLGGDDHDYIKHDNAKALLGGDDHDYIKHDNAKALLGGDDHDYIKHDNAEDLLGGDDHDYIKHINAKALLGGDDHDYLNHKEIKSILGGDDHDFEIHGKRLFGQDLHDYVPHIKENIQGLMNTVGRDTKDQLLQFGKDALESTDAVRKMNILGGDTHDFQPHENDPCKEHREAFVEFKSKHQRLYGSDQEEEEKFQIFCGNMETVKEYQLMEGGSAVYGASVFADISESEFKEKYLGLKMNTDGVKQWPSAEIPSGPIPDSWDWRDHNAVTPVKNQGSCGSCWAFSTTGNIEGINAIKHKKLVSLSEQELLDCDTVDQACNGGLPSQAYEAIMKIGGIETEKDYGYDAAKEKCQFQKSEIAVKLSGAVNISQDEGEMASWLFKNGPISIGINAFAMQFYMGGIAHPWKIFCSPRSLDHGVLIVGYGKQGNEPYWIVKNSWGSGWGREGYYYVYRGDGVCGLNTMCTSATVV